MKPLRIVPADIQPRPGDLGAEVGEGGLKLPRSVAQAMQELGVRNAAELLSHAEAFPTAMAQLMDWSMDDVRTAVDRLRIQLGEPPPKPGGAFSFGALDPSRLPPRK